MAATRQQKELIALAALVVAAASVWYLHLGKSAERNGGISAGYSEINAQDFGKILVDLSKAQGTEYKSAGRNIFVMGAARVEPGKQVAAKEPFRNVGPIPPAPPKPPELPWVFFGYGMLPAGGARQAFLKENQDDAVVHIVSEGDVVLNHLRILHIGNEKIEFEDTETGLKNSKPLEVAPAT